MTDGKTHIKRLTALALALSLQSAPVLAHHSFAMFDRSKTVVLDGTVQSVQMTNPHTWFVVLAPGTDGSVQPWNIEGPSPNILLRMGWKLDDVQVGEKVVLTMNPRRDGTAGGVLVSVQIPGGKTLIGSPPGVK